MTSTWMKSAPAAAIAAISAPRREKSADKMDGAIRTRLIRLRYRDALSARNKRRREFAPENHNSSPCLTSVAHQKNPASRRGFLGGGGACKVSQEQALGEVGGLSANLMGKYLRREWGESKTNCARLCPNCCIYWLISINALPGTAPGRLNRAQNPARLQRAIDRRSGKRGA